MTVNILKISERVSGGIVSITCGIIQYSVWSLGYTRHVLGQIGSAGVAVIGCSEPKPSHWLLPLLQLLTVVNLECDGCGANAGVRYRR